MDQWMLVLSLTMVWFSLPRSLCRCRSRSPRHSLPTTAETPHSAGYHAERKQASRHDMLHCCHPSGTPCRRWSTLAGTTDLRQRRGGFLGRAQLRFASAEDHFGAVRNHHRCQYGGMEHAGNFERHSRGVCDCAEQHSKKKLEHTSPSLRVI